MNTVELTPAYFLDDIAGKMVEPIPRPSIFKSISEKDEILKAINATRINIAEKADTTPLPMDDAKFDHFKSELGMNILLPKGTIDVLRFKINLKPSDVVAVDGVPGDSIRNASIIEGTVNIGISKLLKFVPIPMLGQIPDDLIKIEPIKFRIGDLKKVDVDFSGGLTATPEWYFKDSEIKNKNDVRVAITIKKPKNIESITAEVEAYWSYYEDFLSKWFKWNTLGTGKKVIEIYHK